MGTSAHVLALGPFRRALVPFLRHPPERYADTREGALFIEQPLSADFSSQSRELARCLGVEVWDLNTHPFDPWRVDLEALRAAGQDERRLQSFVALREAGFTFFFVPNG